MEEVFINIMEQIAREMPELSLIDEDYGQLEMGANEDHYPVTFPEDSCTGYPFVYLYDGNTATEISGPLSLDIIGSFVEDVEESSVE